MSAPPFQPSSSARLRPPVAASPPIDVGSALQEASSIALSPDAPSLDPLITALYLKLATSSRDDDIRLRAVHDLADMRGHFARARVRAEVGGSAALASLTLRPDLFARLVGGLSDLGLVGTDVAQDLDALVAPQPISNSL